MTCGANIWGPFCNYAPSLLNSYFSNPGFVAPASGQPCACIKITECFSFSSPSRFHRTLPSMDSLPFETNTERPAYPTPDEGKGDTGIPSIPSYWQYDTNRRASFFPGLRRLVFLVFRFLCLIAFGAGNLKKLWNACYPNPQDKESEEKREKAWESEATRVKERLEHLNLVVRPPSVNEHFVGFD